MVSRRWVPPGSPPDWPDDVAMPQVMLDMGIWSFTLWVTDDKGAISTPDTIKITIGNVVDPAVQQCADNVVMTEPEACRLCVCGQSEMCRGVVTSDKCDRRVALSGLRRDGGNDGLLVPHDELHALPRRSGGRQPRGGVLQGVPE
jgi:hypothetical protein